MGMFDLAGLPRRLLWGAKSKEKKQAAERSLKKRWLEVIFLNGFSPPLPLLLMPNTCGEQVVAAPSTLPSGRVTHRLNHSFIQVWRLPSSPTQVSVQLPCLLRLLKMKGRLWKLSTQTEEHWMYSIRERLLQTAKYVWSTILHICLLAYTYIG